MGIIKQYIGKLKIKQKHERFTFKVRVKIYLLLLKLYIKWHLVETFGVSLYRYYFLPAFASKRNAQLAFSA